MKKISEDELQELEEMELRILEAIWSLETSLVEILRRVQDLEIQLERLKSH